MRRGRQSGFTLVEIMVSLAVIVIGLLGILALQTTTMRSNRQSRGLERARVYAAQIMEELRAKSVANIGATTFDGGKTFSDIVTPDGMTYTRTFTSAPVTGYPNLILITATASFIDDSDGTTHSATVQLLRTNQERL